MNKQSVVKSYNGTPSSNIKNTAAWINFTGIMMSEAKVL